nr:unnamed protein product [Digitaria exilis]
MTTSRMAVCSAVPHSIPAQIPRTPIRRRLMYATVACHPPPMATPEITGCTLLSSMVAASRYATFPTAACISRSPVKTAAKLFR